MQYQSAYDLVEANGKTIRENNLENQHNIPVGSLVEVKYTKWHGGGACSRVHARLWVVKQIRDCDNTPLYCLAQDRLEEHSGDPENIAVRKFHGWVTGFSEESLTVVEVTDALKRGEGQLDWEDEE